MSATPKLGAFVRGDATLFALFATGVEHAGVRIFSPGGAIATHPLLPLDGGYFAAEVPGIGPGARYKFLLDDRELTDPYARFLPDGVHGAAMVVAPPPKPPARAKPRPLGEHVFYELHLGAFTPEGTYASAAKHLDYLRDLGVTAVELMPISSFPGKRGWGYDGVAHFAPFAPYGTPDDLRRFLDTAHRLELSVILDVVYNHWGPSGNVLAAYSPLYFTHEIQNAWGDAPRFDAEPMRRYVIDNALYWLTEFDFDGLRVDAIHAVVDPSPVHVLKELVGAVKEAAPGALIIAEDERNDPTCVTDTGFDAVWADDFHHQVRVTLTGERDGYYEGYLPGAEGLARIIERGWLYEGQTSPHHGAPRGKKAGHLLPEAFVYCIQNHDQIGNRAFGTRLCHDADLDAYCLSSVLLSYLPMTPLLFMGQEWAASTPFLFFTDHDADLGPLITAGRRREFAKFEAFSREATRDAIPDPQASATFERSKLVWDERLRDPHARVLALYRQLLALRRSDPVLRRPCTRSELSAVAEGDFLAVRRVAPGGQGRVLLANFGRSDVPASNAPWPLGGRIVFSFGEVKGRVLGPRAAIIGETG